MHKRNFFLEVFSSFCVFVFLCFGGVFLCFLGVFLCFLCVCFCFPRVSATFWGRGGGSAGGWAKQIDRAGAAKPSAVKRTQLSANAVKRQRS